MPGCLGSCCRQQAWWADEIASDRLSGLVSGKTIQRKLPWLVTDGTGSYWSVEWGWAGHGCLPSALVGVCPLTHLPSALRGVVFGWVSV